MDQHTVYREEQDRLQETKREIARQLAGIGPRYYGKDLVEQALDAMFQEKKQRLELLQREPYFGRLDFQEDGAAAPERLYIGKRGMDLANTGEPWIIDWRAPVASLFYSFTGGEEPVAYEAPDGQVRGVMHLKRNLVIRDGTLERVVDTYARGADNLGVSDEFLLYRLGESKDHRLRDIVATIQSEQDRIIRAPADTALLIQGAAGSGKTTVALHRLAYLLYQYRGRMRAERLVIFAPNPMFLDYISDVLPELGVGNIRQTTFADWAMEQLNLREEPTGARMKAARRGPAGTRRKAGGELPSNMATGADEAMSSDEAAVKRWKGPWRSKSCWTRRWKHSNAAFCRMRILRRGMAPFCRRIRSAAGLTRSMGMNRWPGARSDWLPASGNGCRRNFRHARMRRCAKAAASPASDGCGRTWASCLKRTL